MKRTKLVTARARKSWTLETAAEQIGCAPNTLSRWELGSITPSFYNKERICAAYGMTMEQLGLTEEESLSLVGLPGVPDDLRALLNADFTLRLMALVFTPPCNPLKLQTVLARTIEEYTMNTGHEAELTRREALRRLAMLPVMLGMTGSLARPVEETLQQCAAGITACDHLSKGNHEDISLAFSMLSAYLPTLEAIVKESSLYRKEAATLAAQSYLIKDVLGLHVEGLAAATRYGKLAVAYSKESGDMGLLLTALRRLTWAYTDSKQSKLALQTIEQAQHLIETSRTPLSPRVCSSIYGALAEMQVKNGLASPPALHLAQEMFFAKPVESSNGTLSNADFSYAQLMRNDGYVHYIQGLYQEAFDAYAQVVDPETLAPKVKMPVRTHAELLHKITMVALKRPTRDMEQVITFWKADLQSATDLQSEQRFEKACTAYEVMAGVWPGEPHIMELRDLIVHW